MLDQSTIVYIAAILDSQAVIRTRDANGVTYPYIAMSGSNTELLQFMARSTGVRAITTRRGYSRAGCAQHCAEKHQHIVSVSGRWSLNGAKATVLLSACLPYLRLQRDAALQAIAVGLTAPYKPATVRKMEEELGWPVPEFGEVASSA